MPEAEQSPRRFRLKWIAIAVATALVGLGIGWAGATLLSPPRDALTEADYTLAEVVQGEVGSSINLNTAAEWNPIPLGTNLASGTVTTIDVKQGASVSQGDIVFTVNLRPVVVAQGDVPAFRPMSQGTKGTDVQQLQEMLTALNHNPGKPDGLFGYGTYSAVKAWQRSIGVPADGIVQAGDVIFLPTLPTRIALDEKVTRGARLSGGETVVSVLPLQPNFSIPVTEGQAALIPEGTRVEISSPSGKQWEALVVETRKDDKAISLILAGKDDQPICGDDCADLPVLEQSLLPSKVFTVEGMQGLTVPSAALVSKADGSIVVIGEDGTEYEVKVKASARGMSIIMGVDNGALVRVPAGAT